MPPLLLWRWSRANLATLFHRGGKSQSEGGSITDLLKITQHTFILTTGPIRSPPQKCSLCSLIPLGVRSNCAHPAPWLFCISLFCSFLSFSFYDLFKSFSNLAISGSVMCHLRLYSQLEDMSSCPASKGYSED